MTRHSRLTEITADLFMFHQPIATGTVTETLSYLLPGDDGVTLVDPGTDGEANWELLREALAAIGRSPADVAHIVATHLHADHLGMAERVRRASGGAIVLHRAEQTAVDARYGGDSTLRLGTWGVPAGRRAELEDVITARAGRPTVTANHLVEDRDVLRLGGRMATVLWTPGHTTGSICLDLPDAGILLTGDHLLPTMHPGIGLGGPSPTNLLCDYLASLDRVRTLGERLALPGHGHPFPNAAARCRETAAHHLRRAEEVSAALDTVAQRLTVWQLASRLRWNRGWEHLRLFALDSALRQTEMHVERLGRLDELETGEP